MRPGGDDDSGFVAPVSDPELNGDVDDGERAYRPPMLAAPVPVELPEVTPAPHVPMELDEYCYVRPLGEGGMGEVHLYHDRKLNRPVAIKFLKTRRGVDPAGRFLVEAQAAARLSHPNVVAVFRLGETPMGMPFIVSEYMDSGSLADVRAPRRWREVLGIACDLTAGLQAAHESSILHRDIKPGNVLRSRSGQVKLGDFGLAKFTAETERASQVADRVLMAGLTSPSTILGTPEYMPPEAWRAEPLTPAADLYSLGVVLYELCAGASPFPGLRLVGERRAAALQREPLPLRRAAPSVDARFAAIIDRLLRRDPRARFPSAGALLEALRTLQQGSRRWAPVPGFTLVGLLAVTLVGGTVRTKEPHRSPPPGMVALPGGRFLMGSTASEAREHFELCQAGWNHPLCRPDIYEREQPQHEVELSPFAIDRFEVNNLRFANFLNERRARVTKGAYLTDRDGALLAVMDSESGVELRAGSFLPKPAAEERPAVFVSWYGAARFCAAYGQELPTEAQWEYAARGAARRRFPWGDVPPTCEGVAFDRERGGQCASLATDGPQQGGRSTQDRTPEGVMDLGGNVGEWVRDHFLTESKRYPACAPPCRDPVVDPPVIEGNPAASQVRVVRGGDYRQPSHVLLAAGRSRLEPGATLRNIGFRCVVAQKR